MYSRILKLWLAAAKWTFTAVASGPMGLWGATLT